MTDRSAARRSGPSGRLNDVDSWSTGQVAEHLGTSIPTVRRVARRLGIGAVDGGGRLLLSAEDVAALERDIGRVPRIDGLRRSQVQVLAALARAPLGLRSERAVARAARLSPTAAGRALDELVDAGLVCHERRTLAEGTAVEGGLWRVRIGPRWFRIAPVVATTVLPERTDWPESPTRLPRRLWHLFWNADPADLDLQADADYIATRLVLSDDLQGLAWACAHLPAAALRVAAANRGADARTRALVDNVLAAA